MSDKVSDKTAGKWMWEQIAPGRTPAGERFTERRTLWFTPNPDDAAATSHNAVPSEYGDPLYERIPKMADDLNAAEARRSTEQHPATCGGTYEGLGFVDAEQRVWRARCVIHGRRLVEGPIGGPFTYVIEPGSASDPQTQKTNGELRRDALLAAEKKVFHEIDRRHEPQTCDCPACHINLWMPARPDPRSARRAANHQTAMTSVERARALIRFTRGIGPSRPPAHSEVEGPDEFDIRGAISLATQPGAGVSGPWNNAFVASVCRLALSSLSVQPEVERLARLAWTFKAYPRGLAGQDPLLGVKSEDILRLRSLAESVLRLLDSQRKPKP